MTCDRDILCNILNDVQVRVEGNEKRDILEQIVMNAEGC